MVYLIAFSLWVQLWVIVCCNKEKCMLRANVLCFIDKVCHNEEITRFMRLVPVIYTMVCHLPQEIMWPIRYQMRPGS